MIYDCAIIGTGPAGLSAALNLKIREKSFIWLGSRNFSEKVIRAEKILNYPGIPEATGKELFDAFKKHADSMGLEITEKMVNQIVDMKTHYALMAGDDFYEAKTIIMATGVISVGTLKGETEKVGRGVSYCATCDGGLYRGKEIAVICTNSRFEHEVLYLAGLASKIYYFARYKDLGNLPENVEIMEVLPKEVLGEMRVSGLLLSDGTELQVNGIFCLRDNVSLNTLLPALETEDGHIVVDRNMKTNLRGVYACGDCTGRPYQYTKAVGEGNIAAHSVVEEV